MYNMSIQPNVDQIAVIIGVVVPLAVLCIAISLCCILRRCRNNSNNAGGNYEQVNHGLDDEELAFKRLLEKRKTGETEMTGLSSADSPGNGQYNSNMFDDDLYDDVAFDSSELDTLNRLENFRSNLVAAAGDNKNNSNNSSSSTDKNRNFNGDDSEANEVVANDDIRL